MNNASVLAKLLIGKNKTVAIIDVDYHGGDGTYDCRCRLGENAEFVSIHAKDDYPEIQMQEHGIECPPKMNWKK